MAIERTFSIIKPDATARNLTGAINAMIEQAGLRIVAQKRVRITRRRRETFYAVHRERPFFGELVDFMISGPVVVQVLEGDNAIAKYRDIMGATDPAKAAPGTIRKVHAKSIGENSVHGSDAPDTAAQGDRPVLFRATRSSAEAAAQGRWPRVAGGCSSTIRGADAADGRLHALGHDGGSEQTGLRVDFLWQDLTHAPFWLAARQDHRGSTSCCPATTPSSSRWPAAACRRGSGSGAWSSAPASRCCCASSSPVVVATRCAAVSQARRRAGAVLRRDQALVTEDAGRRRDVEAVEHLWRAVRIVAIADIVMSLDNVIAIAAAAQVATMALLVIGLAISMPLIVRRRRAVHGAARALPVLVWGGGALLGWIAGDVMATDPVVARLSRTDTFGGAVAHTSGTSVGASVGAVLVLVGGRPLAAFEASSARASEV